MTTRQRSRTAAGSQKNSEAAPALDGGSQNERSAQCRPCRHCCWRRSSGTGLRSHLSPSARYLHPRVEPARGDDRALRWHQAGRLSGSTLGRGTVGHRRRPARLLSRNLDHSRPGRRRHGSLAALRRTAARYRRRPNAMAWHGAVGETAGGAGEGRCLRTALRRLCLGSIFSAHPASRHRLCRLPLCRERLHGAEDRGNVPGAPARRRSTQSTGRGFGKRAAIYLCQDRGERPHRRLLLHRPALARRRFCSHMGRS